MEMRVESYIQAANNFLGGEGQEGMNYIFWYMIVSLDTINMLLL